MTITKLIARAGAALIAGGTIPPALAHDVLTVSAAEDGAVEATRKCDVFITGVATSTRPDPLAYRWLDEGNALSAWTPVRADGTAPLDLCDLAAGRHTLTVEVTDGRQIVSDSMEATIGAAPSLIARGDAPGR